MSSWIRLPKQIKQSKTRSWLRLETLLLAKILKLKAPVTATRKKKKLEKLSARFRNNKTTLMSMRTAKNKMLSEVKPFKFSLKSLT